MPETMNPETDKNAFSLSSLIGLFQFSTPLIVFFFLVLEHIQSLYLFSIFDMNIKYNIKLNSQCMFGAVIGPGFECLMRGLCG